MFPLFLLSASGLAAASQVSAGMTVITLTDIARAWIEALSFFLSLYLGIAWVVKIVWTQSGKIFALLP